MVRASSDMTIFDKGYMPNWNNEHFTVSKALSSSKGTKRRVFNLMDYNNKIVKRSFYPAQILEISDNQYRIEKVLRKRTLPDGTKHYLSSARLARQIHLVNKKNRQVRCRR